jgi:hypothetical protein
MNVEVRAAARPADGQSNAQLHCHGSELLTGVLAAASRVKDHWTGGTTLTAGGSESVGRT